MKNLINLITIVSINITFLAETKAQNLVSNPSFEDTVACPTNVGQVDKATNWSSFGNTPDYFNACSNGSVNVPNNILGYQYPHSGNAYCGFGTNAIGDSTYKEFIGAQLINPLEIGQKYYVSFYLNFAGSISDAVACNKIGILFTFIRYSLIDPAPVNNFAHFKTDSIINDTVNWVLVKGSFISDSSYKYLCIGSFFYPSQFDTINNGHQFSNSYYFIDDICVSKDSLTCFGTHEDVPENNLTDGLYIFPNPANHFLNINFDRHLPFSVTVLNAYGQEVLKTNSRECKKTIAMDVSSLSKGLYFLKINYLNNETTKRVLIIN